MRIHIQFILLSLSVIAFGEPTTSVQRIDGIRKMKSLERPSQIEEAALAYLSSCQSSTPLSGGAGASPSLAILNYRDLIATHPITVIRLKKSVAVDDKSGIKSEPPLKIIDITVVELEGKKINVYAHTYGHGHLVHFGRPTKEAEDRLTQVIQNELKKEAQQDAPSNGG